MFHESMKKIWKMNHPLQNQLLFESLTERFLIVALREIKFEYQDESDQFSTFGYCRTPDFRYKEIHALLGSKVIFYD